MGAIKKLLLVCLLTVSGLSYEVSDMLGEITASQKDPKIVFVGPGALRLGVYLGLEDNIVGIEAVEKQAPKISPYREKINQKGLVQKSLIVGQGGPGKLPSSEALISSGATLIVASFINKNDVKMLKQQTNIPVFVVSYGEGYGGNSDKLEAIKESLLKLGEVTHKQARAKEIVNFMNRQSHELKELNLKPQSVYIGGMGYKGAQGITSTESNYPPFELLGLENIFTKSVSGHLFVSLESIIEADPEAIFLDSLGKEIVKSEMESKKELFELLSAYKNSKIFWLRAYNFYNTNIENVFICAWEIAKALGAEVDTKAKTDEILKQFLDFK